MNLKVDLVPIFEDNYVFIVQQKTNRQALVIDPGEAKNVIKFIELNELHIEGILLTHHHDDHIGGVEQLNEYLESRQGARVNIIAPIKNKIEISFADDYVGEGMQLNFLGELWTVIELPGHTLGHVAFYCGKENLLFSGDVLFGLGCGRLFEGSYKQGWESLQAIAKLPPETLVYCTHEYTEKNMKFCQAFNYELADYAANLPSVTVPLNLNKELRANPFLKAASAADFEKIRELRNKFKG